MQKKDQRIENDMSMINNLVTSQKTTKKKEKRHYNEIVNKIINILRNKERPCTVSELQKAMEDVDLRNKDFISQINQNDSKIKYDDKKDIFYLKSKYIMHNIEELKDLIRSSEHGLLEDEELTDSYPGIKQDLDKLKRENIVKVIPNTEKNCSVLFYRDMADKFEKVLINPEYTEAIKELRKIWKDELAFYDTSDKNEYLFKKRLRPDVVKRKGEKRRRIRNNNLKNTHIDIEALLNPSYD